MHNYNQISIGDSIDQTYAPKEVWIFREKKILRTCFTKLYSFMLRSQSVLDDIYIDAMSIVNAHLILYFSLKDEILYLSRLLLIF